MENHKIFRPGLRREEKLLGDYIKVDGPWLRGRAEGILAELRRLNKMSREGKKKDDEGLSIALQISELRTERNLLKEVLKHAINTDKKDGGKG